MKNLDHFSKRIITVAVAFGILFSSLALFLFALSTVSKSFAGSTKSDVLPTGLTVEGYQIIGVATSGTTVYAVGFDKNKGEGYRIKTFR